MLAKFNGWNWCPQKPVEKKEKKKKEVEHVDRKKLDEEKWGILKGVSSQTLGYISSSE